uniref:Unconventional myosin-XVIIIa n=1 Tax=Enterobius vermicularis TaxID=51028 RepID=A0A0N4V7F6_ENTVE
LETQNERLRAQNLRCTAQLEVLKNCADRTKHWRNSALFSQSVIVSLKHLFCRVFKTRGTLQSMMLDRTSDDSGLTSDDTWERKTDLMTQSASVVYKDDSLKHLKKPVRLRSSSRSHQGAEEETSSTTDSSPWEEKLKPVPTPRKTKQLDGALEPALIERDSLNSYEDDNDYRDEDDEIFDEIDFSHSPRFLSCF